LIKKDKAIEEGVMSDPDLLVYSQRAKLLGVVIAKVQFAVRSGLKGRLMYSPGRQAWV
jgi:hypothetical protein